VSTSSRGCGGLGCHWVEFPKLYIFPFAQPETQPRVAEDRTYLALVPVVTNHRKAEYCIIPIDMPLWDKSVACIASVREDMYFPGSTTRCCFLIKTTEAYINQHFF
jgi:hypothetical protein